MSSEHFQPLSDLGQLRARELERMARQLDRDRQYTPGGAFLDSSAGTVLVPPVQSSSSGSVTFSGCQVRLNTTQVIPDTVVTALSWTSADYDTDSYFHAGTPTVITIPATGKYLMRYSVTWNFGAGTYRYASLDTPGLYGGDDYKAPLAAGSVHFLVDIRGFSAGHTFSVYAGQDSGGGLGVNGVFAIYKLPGSS